MHWPWIGGDTPTPAADGLHSPATQSVQPNTSSRVQWMCWSSVCVSVYMLAQYWWSAILIVCDPNIYTPVHIHIPTTVHRPPRPQQSPPPAHAGLFAPSMRQDANRAATTPTNHNHSSGGGHYMPGAAQMDNAQTRPVDADDGSDRKHLVDQLCQQLEQTQLAAMQKEH
uniref:Uncharacterized protein n=1 Tax=Vitrella brassicaformis TaxID=1169539 RepID=A0A6U4GMS1_9ALVE